MTTIITGPNGEKRPADPWASAAMVAKIATGQMDEIYTDEDLESYLDKIEMPKSLPKVIRKPIILREPSIESKEETSPSTTG